MAQILGFHHVSLPARDTAVTLQHPAGMLLALHLSPDQAPPRRGLGAAALSFWVASQDDLLLWDNRLTELGIEHSGPRPAHLGWALDVVDPSGLRIQLHTHELISADDE